MVITTTSSFPPIEALAAEHQRELLDEAGRQRLVRSARRAPPWRRTVGHGLVRLGLRIGRSRPGTVSPPAPVAPIVRARVPSRSEERSAA